MSKDKEAVEKIFKRIRSNVSLIETSMGISLGNRESYEKEFGDTAENFRKVLKEYESKVSEYIK